MTEGKNEYLLDWRRFLEIGGTELGLDRQDLSRKTWANGRPQSSWRKQRRRAGGHRGTSDSRAWGSGWVDKCSDRRKGIKQPEWEAAKGRALGNHHTGGR